MPAVQSPKAGRAQAVLFVGPGRVEWLELAPRDAVLLGRREVLGEAPGDVARAAGELLRELGRPPARCVVVLADELLAERVVPVPVLPPAELRAALRRKAANLAGSPPRDTVFCALRLGLRRPGAQQAEGEIDKWLLFAREHAFLLELSLQLRRRGFTAERLVPARTIALGALGEPASPAADEAASEPEPGSASEEARICVGIEPTAAVLSLVHGSELIHQSLIAGELGPESSLGATLVQELRGLELFWRKASRGGEVGEVVVVGLEPEQASSMQPAVCAALPGVRATFRPSPTDLRPDAGRVEALRAALTDGPFAVDLSLRLPPRPALIGTLTGVLGALAAIAGLIGIGRLEASRAGWQAATATIHETSQGLPSLRQERRKREAALERVRARQARLAALDRLGMPYDEMLLDFTEAFRGRGAFTTLAFTKGPTGVQIDATGETLPDPLLGLVALEEIRRALEASPHFRAVEIVPPSRLPERAPAGGQRSSHLSFGLRARREVTR